MPGWGRKAADLRGETKAHNVGNAPSESREAEVGQRLMFENSTVCLIVDGISLCDLLAMQFWLCCLHVSLMIDSGLFLNV